MHAQRYDGVMVESFLKVVRSVQAVKKPERYKILMDVYLGNIAELVRCLH